MRNRYVQAGRSSLAGLALYTLLAVAGFGFALFNGQQMALLRALDRDGMTTIGHVTGFTPSHKACNASIRVAYTAGSFTTVKGFQVCGGNYAVGQGVTVRYLPSAPASAMLAAADAPFDPGNYPRGLAIGLGVGLLGLIMAIRTIRARQAIG